MEDPPVMPCKVHVILDLKVIGRVHFDEALEDDLRVDQDGALGNKAGVVWVEGPRLTERLQEAIPPLHGGTGLSLCEPQVLVVAHLELGPQPAVDSLVVEWLPRVAGQPEEAAQEEDVGAGLTHSPLQGGPKRWGEDAKRLVRHARDRLAARCGVGKPAEQPRRLREAEGAGQADGPDQRGGIALSGVAQGAARLAVGDYCGETVPAQDRGGDQCRVAAAAGGADVPARPSHTRAGGDWRRSRRRRRSKPGESSRRRLGQPGWSALSRPGRRPVRRRREGLRRPRACRVRRSRAPAHGAEPRLGRGGGAGSRIAPSHPAAAS
mmetsp:Transcript_35917/g.118916  ORF Transcript_35917/g.118916 Transcript_35917/m.118916 type:complete len:322 (-) Transcript_35917:300-1265(-)